MSFYKTLICFAYCWLVVEIVTARKYEGCIGTEDDCCAGQVELLSGDSLTLETKSGQTSGTWCERQILVRKSQEDDDDECGGCTLTVRFLDYSKPFLPTIELLQASYDAMIFYGSELLFFHSFAKYGGGSPNMTIPESVNTTGTVLKVTFANTEGFNGHLKMVITPNVQFPPFKADAWVGVGIAVVVAVIVSIGVCIGLKVRRRRQARISRVILVNQY